LRQFSFFLEHLCASLAFASMVVATNYTGYIPALYDYPRGASFRPKLVLRVCIRDVMDFAASAARLVKFFKGRFCLFPGGV
jgi:hypothetical protein